MPHSPYSQIVYPPIRDLDEFRRDLNGHRVSWENDERDKERDELLLDIGESLIEHCDFLEEKLKIKKREYNQLTQRHDVLKKKSEASEAKNEALEAQIEILKSERETLDTKVTALEDSEPTEPSGENNTPETIEMSNSRKRGAEGDDAIDGTAVKKGKLEKEGDVETEVLHS